MSLKERISHFWNETLGVDCPEEENVLDSQNPENNELKESLARVDGLEKKYEKSTSSNNGGKGTSKKIVEKAKVDTAEAIDKAEQKSTEPKAMDGEER